jgi:hypothetical protein
VRFYVSAGLIDRPEGTGTAATYNYRHLLQLLAVKIRQREGQSLDSIKSEVRTLTGDVLEKRVASSLEPALVTRADQAAMNDARGDTPATWRRVGVADGIELHVRADSGASGDEVVVAMREAVRAALGRFTR